MTHDLDIAALAAEIQLRFEYMTTARNAYYAAKTPASLRAYANAAQDYADAVRAAADFAESPR